MHNIPVMKLVTQKLLLCLDRENYFTENFICFKYCFLLHCFEWIFLLISLLKFCAGFLMVQVYECQEEMTLRRGNALHRGEKSPSGSYACCLFCQGLLLVNE